MPRQATESSFSSMILRVVISFCVLVSVPAVADVQFAKDGNFSRDTVITLAKELSTKPYKAPPQAPDVLSTLSYDQYRAIRFRPDKALWADEQLPYRMQMLQAGAFFKNTVELATVSNGQAHHVAYSPELFTVEPPANIQLPQQDIGYSGFRLHTPLNKPNIWDELVVFQGASYFRSLGRHQIYGLSARGLAVKTGSAEGEEFPVFKAFWIERPTNDANSVVINALLDSPSVAGAYRFTVRPGDNTVMDVEATLFPRVDLKDVGLAPGTSMYDFSLNGRQGVDDFRPQVHDSDGLLMVNGRNERIWRPLANPAKLQISAFVDTSPIGFGLMQRDRDFEHYQDLEAQYEKRPSLWVEPLGDWGKGAVVLTEIPTESEIHDNIVAFWKPAQVIAAHKAYSFAYRLSWGTGPDTKRGEVMVSSTRQGRADLVERTPRRRFVIDYKIPRGGDELPGDMPTADLSASAGKINHVVVRRNPATDGYRVSFILDPEGADLSELRVKLNFTDNRPVETWVYRWTAE